VKGFILSLHFVLSLLYA